MPLLHRRLLPTAVRAQLDLPAGDALLATAELADGSYAASSRFALHHLFPAESGRPLQSWPWSDVDKAALDAESAVLKVTLVDGSTVELALTENRHRSFPQSVRERVQASVVHASSTTLPSGHVVRVAVRRSPEGELFSQVITDAVVDLADPATARVVDDLENQVRAAAGLS